MSEARWVKVERFLTVLEKIAIPVALGALSYFIAQGSDQFAQTQLEFARQQEFNRLRDAQATLDAKYTEMFYKEIFGGDKAHQETALAILRQFRPALQVSLGKVLETLGNPEVKQQAQAVVQAANASILQGFTLQIYYLESNLISKSHADRVAAALRQGSGFASVRVSGVSQKFLDNYEVPAGYEVRYEVPYEVDQVSLVLDRLRAVDGHTPYHGEVVKNRTPNFISVFLDPNEK